MRAVSFGLVPNKTTDKVRIERHATRLNRLKRGVLTSARLHAQAPGRSRVAMITPTYRPGVAWKPEHITGLAKNIREYLRAKGEKFRYVWVMELTKIGTPHYHMLVWLPKGMSLPMPDKRGWWKHGSTRIEWVKKAVGYCAKYASKGAEPEEIPLGARLYGVGGLDAVARAIKSWWLKPGWIRDVCSMSDDVTAARGGGFVARATGERFPARWRVCDRAKDWSWLDLERVPA